MKKVFLLLTALFTMNFAFAFVDCTDSMNGCTIKQLIEISEPEYIKINARPVDTTIFMLQQHITDLQKQIDKLKKSKSVVADQICQKITSKMWLRTSRMTDAQTNGDVSRLQNFFKKIGIINWDGDGEFGTWDRAAVWKFQQQYMPEISPTGDVGVKTMAKINSMICNSTSNKDFVTWKIETINSSIEPPLQRITATLNPEGYGNSYNLGSYEIRNNCAVRNEKYSGSPSNMLLPWVNCYYALSGVNYAVFKDQNSIYSIKSYTNDASGLTTPTWNTLKTVAPYAN